MKQQIQVNNKKRQEYIDVWQKPSQCCKVIILQLKYKLFFFKEKIIFKRAEWLSCLGRGLLSKLAEYHQEYPFSVKSESRNSNMFGAQIFTGVLKSLFDLL
jgi:hypothetical protein